MTAARASGRGERARSLAELQQQVEELHADRDRVRAELEHIEITISEMRYDVLDALHPPATDEEGYFRRLERQMHYPIRATIPRGSTIAVASFGEPNSVRFFGRMGRHFPETTDG